MITRFGAILKTIPYHTKPAVLSLATFNDNFFTQTFSLVVGHTAASGNSRITAYDKSLEKGNQNNFCHGNLNNLEHS